MGWIVRLVTISFVTALAISDEINNISISDTTESWMTPKEFSSLIEASFSVLDCVNIIICDDDVGTERLLKEFINVFPEEYTLNSIERSCNRYFMAASYNETFTDTMSMVSADNLSMEFLVVIDDDIGEPVEVTNFALQREIWATWMYHNANVNIAAQNGLFKLSDNYLISRKFTRVSSYDLMVHKKGIINLEGRQLTAVTFYNPPYCFLNSTEPPGEYWENEPIVFTTEDGEVDGVEVNLFILIAKRLNSTYRFIKPHGDYRYGKREDTDWEGGIIDELRHGDADIAFGSIWLTLDYYELTSLTIPWRQNHIHFLVPRPKPHASFWALTTPLTPEVWAALSVTLLVQSIYVYMAAWINPGVPRRFRSFTNTWTEMMARLLGTWAPKDMRCLGKLFQLWHFIGVLMVTAYSSSLAAKLARKEYDARIDTIEDFLATNLTWGLGGYAEILSVAFDTSDPKYELLMDRFENETSDAERHEKILKGNYAIFGNRIGFAFFPVESVSNEDLQGYRMMRDSVSDNYITFAVAPWLEQSFDAIIERMHEAGLIEYHLNDVLYRRVKSGLHEVLLEKDFNTGEATVLELTPLGAGCLLWLVGLSISTIAFYLELRSVKESRSIREVVHEIRIQRELWRARELNAMPTISASIKSSQSRCVSS